MTAFLDLILFYMYGCLAWMYVHELHEYLVPAEGQKKASEPLGLASQLVVCHHGGIGI